MPYRRALRDKKQDTDSRKTCAGARYAECESAVSKRSSKTFGRTEGTKRQKRKAAIVFFRVGEKCSEEKNGAEKKSGKRWAGTLQRDRW